MIFQEGARSKPPRKPFARPTAPRPQRGRSAWRVLAGAAIADHRAMPQWWLALARGPVQPLQDPREPSARCHPPAAGYTDLDTWSGAEMPVMPEGQIVHFHRSAMPQ